MHTAFAYSLLRTEQGQQSAQAVIESDKMVGMFNLGRKRIEYVWPLMEAGANGNITSLSGNGFRARLGSETIVLLAVGRWMRAKKIRPGDEIVFIDGYRAVKKRVTEVNHETGQPSVMFDVQDGYGLIIDGVVVR
jgi:hypothetical protein